MPLDEYRRKRDFARTPEPAPADQAGAGSGASSGRYVVQRHRATRLHYDFRLEVDGVLASWAVPRGPTLDPSQRRMAIHVEDHPIEYFDFEGVIPARQYGAGDVIVWDWGIWEAEAPTLDAAAAIAAGELKFSLQGEKLKGRFTIVRTGGRKRKGDDPGARAFENDAGDQWLLIHKRDEFAVAGWDAEDYPQSVKTGRTNDDVKAARDAIWIGKAPAASAEIDLAGAVEAPLPKHIEPMLATLASKPFSDPDWLYEIKWDGFRVEAVVDNGKVRIWTRNLKEAETYFPSLLSTPSWIEARQAIVDGEVVALDEAGRPDFGLLQQRLGDRAAGGLVYQAFDLLYLDGRTLLGVPLEDRKRLLKSVLRPHPRVRFAAHVEGEGKAFYEAAQAQQLEGIIAKLRRSTYEPGRRSTAWLKLKVRPEQELVVGGWTPGTGNARDLGALAVGVYEDGQLRFAGKVGSGFDGRTRQSIRERLARLEMDEPPFDPPPPRDYRGRWGGDLREIHWVRPELVIRAELGGWSRDGMVRQAAFKGIEEGRDPATVARERAVVTAEAVRAAEAMLAADGAAEGMLDGSHAAGARSGARSGDADPSDDYPWEISTEAGPVTAGAAARPAARSSRSSHHPRDIAEEGPPTMATPEELDALQRLGKEGTWRIGGHDLKLTNLDKVLFVGDSPVTKRELIRYFARIAPTMLPHLHDRPLNLQRFPNGASAPGFWQKDIPETAPAWLTRWREVGLDGRTDRDANDHLVADRVATLAWLGNQASFEIHAWTGKLPEPWQPTFALIDIDPGPKTTWEETLVLARLFRTALEHLGVRGYPKTTGKRGIQIWIPIVPHYRFDETSAWVERISRAVGSTVPELVSWEWAKEARKGRARLDYTQNASIKTLVAPYS
ncbi:MAG: bifunctional non-ous end joining protein LigD, partial [Chloroflexota bacterium]|nr:bifunctional non-ous end joining protein LigD [Chloroflexota bacterium]